MGRILSIQEAGSFYPRYEYDTVSLEAAGGGASPSIEAGSQEVTVNLTVVYEIR